MEILVLVFLTFGVNPITKVMNVDNVVKNESINDAPRVPRKKGQHRGSKSHSDLYTDENPKGTIKGLKVLTFQGCYLR